MKHFISGMMIALALVAALVMGVVAMAENTAHEAPEMPPVEEAQPEQVETEQDAQQPDTDAATDDSALREALDAYKAAKQSGRQEALEAELKGYVESGKLTQEQADLILNEYKEQEARRSGTCPNCGYQFQDGSGMAKGSRMSGGRGANGGKGNRMNGGNMFGRQPSAQQPSVQQPTFGQQPGEGSTNGTAMQPDAQATPNMSGNEGI